jgi:O-antigen/teichoic acid export membrane protein
VGPAIAVVVALFVLSLPLGIVERVRMAFQEGFLNSIAAAAAAVLSLLLLLAAIAVGASLPLLILLVSASSIAALAVNGYRLFWRDRPWLRPRPALARFGTAITLGRIGFLFLVLQVAVVVAFQSDVVVAAVILGPEDAAVYSVTLKVFLVVPTLLSLYFATLWPAYTEAIRRGDTEWVRATLRRSSLAALFVAGVASLVLAIAGPTLIRWWTAGAVDPPLVLVLGAAVWAVVSSAFSAISILLNAASVILFQVIVAIAMAAVSIGLSVWLANEVGLVGIIWGTVLAYVVIAAIPIALYLPRFLRGLDEQSAPGGVA